MCLRELVDVMSSDDGDSESDYIFESNVGSRRYPVHDCCEFEDAERLKRLIFVRQEESSEDDYSSSSSSSALSGTSNTGTLPDEDQSDEDDNSIDAAHEHAAAAAAAMGHSPAVPPSVQNSCFDAANSLGVGVLNMETDDAELPRESTVDDQHCKLGGKGQQNLSQCEEDMSDGNENVKGEKGGTKCDELEDLQNQSIVAVDERTQKLCNAPDMHHRSVGISTHATSVEESSINFEDKTKTKEKEDAATAEILSNGVDRTLSRRKDCSRDEAFEERASDDGTSDGVSSEAATKGEKQRKRKQKREPRYYCPYDLNERDLDENTPLHIAIHTHKIDCVRLLLEAGASAHRKCDGSAPVHTAISLGAVSAHANFAAECLSALISHGADLAVKDECLHTPLYLTAMANLPRCASLILHDATGMTTLNMRADRSGGRVLHACAKFDVRMAPAHHHKPIHHPHRHQGAQRHPNHVLSSTAMTDTSTTSINPAILTKMLLSTPGIEVDPTNTYGSTPLHIAASRGNWPVARLLLQHGANPDSVDHRGFTVGALASKRGMVIPSDLMRLLGGDVQETHEKRDLIMDPNSNTIILYHELCALHKSCPPISRGGVEGGDPPPENVRRLQVLINADTGILKSEEFHGCAWETKSRRAAMSDVLKVHEYSYVEKISLRCSSLPDHPSAIASLDPDTAVSHWSFEAALRASGAVCEAVDKIMAGDHRNAFCAIRPPGHHAGPRGIVTCPNDPDGSHGFCLLNNIAIGAAYARSMYRNDGIKKVAIIDFDVHHGNGTEEIIRQLVPTIELAAVQTPIAIGSFQTVKYRPWLDENDIKDVFFASTHGYGPRDVRFIGIPNHGGWFYPASGSTQVTDSVRNSSAIEQPSLSDFLLTQTWARMGEMSRNNCCKIIDIGLDLPRPNDIPGMQRVDLRDSYRKTILPYLMEFNPDMIFISAGFDAHKRDTMNFGYVGMIEEDYEWVTEQLVKVANSCCNGRIVSVLEGGYKIHGGIVSPFARSVASHVRAMVDAGSSREMYSTEDLVWESRFERHVVEEKERKRQLKIDKIFETERRRLRAEDVAHSAAKVGPLSSEEASGRHNGDDGMLTESLHNAENAQPLLGNSSSQVFSSKEVGYGANEAIQRKRRRNQVDYKQLYEQMRKEEKKAG